MKACVHGLRLLRPALQAVGVAEREWVVLGIDVKVAAVDVALGIALEEPAARRVVDTKDKVVLARVGE
jgi:hypothetical protein